MISYQIALLTAFFSITCLILFLRYSRIVNQLKLDMEKAKNQINQQQIAVDQYKIQIQKNESKHQSELEETKKALQNEIEKREKAQFHIMEISEREQLRIGHELHDGVVHDLTALSLAGDMVYKEIHDEFPDTADKLKGFINIVDQCTTKLRSLAKGLSPVNLSKAGLVEVIRQFAQQTYNLSGVSCLCEADESISVSNHEVALHLYRIIHEAVNNAVKHSHATQILIQLNENNGALQITVTDNGIGFDAEPQQIEGMGLHIMNYRAELTGALFHIQSNPNKGTKIVLTVPLVNLV